MSRWYSLLVMVLLCSVPAQAFGAVAIDGAVVTPGADFQLYTIPHCIGVVKLKISPQVGCTAIKGCSLNGAIWECQCSNIMPLVLSTTDTCSGTYNIIAQYSVDGKSDRIQNFNNIRVGDLAGKPVKKPSSIKPENFVRVGVQLFILAIVVSVIAIWMIRKLFREPPDDIIDERYSWDRKKERETTTKK